jgi:hypothetical protein
MHKLHTPSVGRRNNLNGEWKGFVWPQSLPSDPKEVPTRFIFDVHKKVVTGEMSFKSPDPSRGVIVNYLTGGFLSDEDLKFIYSKKKPGVIGWGSLMLKLSPDARRMDGLIVGLSSHLRVYFSAKVLLLKGKNPALSRFSIEKKTKPTVFIGHGKDGAWKQLKSFIQKLGYKVETFESGPRAGKHISDVIAGMMTRASFAILVMTGDDITATGTKRARQNVVYELGLCQGTLGHSRAIILLEEDVEDFSNVHGIQYIKFKKGKLSDCFKELAATIRRELPKHS